MRGADGGGVPTDSSFGFTNDWAKTHNVKNTEPAEMVVITPQGVTEIFKGRNQPTGETGSCDVGANEGSKIKGPTVTPELPADG